MLGISRIDSSLCMVNPIWEITLDKEKLKRRGPFTLVLAQNEYNRETVEISDVFDENSRKADKQGISLNLKTMVSDQYWLDTGCFDI